MIRRSEKENVFEIEGQKASMRFFVYDYSF